MSDGVSLGNGLCRLEGHGAILVDLDEGEALWIPQSVVHDDSEVYGYRHEGNVVVELWWAESKGLA
jgi:hypothetical protein